MTASLNSDQVRRKVPSGHRFATSAFWRLLPGGMRRRWWLFRPLDLLAYWLPVRREPKGLLVVRMDGIGDMVLFRRALDHYGAAFGVPASAITVLGCDAWASVASELFAGYRVKPIDEHRFAKDPWYRFRVALWVRFLRPAVTVNDAYFRRALMADSLTWLSRAPRQISSLPYISERTRAEYTWYLGQVTEIVDTGRYPVHEIERHFTFLSRVAGKEIWPARPKLTWRDAKPPLPDGAPYVLLNPGSNEPGRRWPFAHYAALAGRLADAGHRVVFVGGKDRAAGTVPAKPGIVDLTGRTDLPELFDLIKHAKAVVTNDSGPAHVSIALGTPTVVVVGGGHFGCFVPYPAKLTPPGARFVWHKMPCYHCFWRCHLRRDDSESFPCVAGVTDEQVWTALSAIVPGIAA
jgi:ADP-heptose:LPS heptosyltransferase